MCLMGGPLLTLSIEKAIKQGETLHSLEDPLYNSYRGKQ